MTDFNWIEEDVPEEKWTLRGGEHFVRMDMELFMKRSGSYDFSVLAEDFKRWQASRPSRMHAMRISIPGEPGRVEIVREIS